MMESLLHVSCCSFNPYIIIDEFASGITCVQYFGIRHAQTIPDDGPLLTLYPPGSLP
ncbi:hypothetical protein D3C81_2207950 [compost metagenome]